MPSRSKRNLPHIQKRWFKAGAISKIIPIVDPNQPIDYQASIAPSNYCCHKCYAQGVKLWREYQTFLNNQTLLCAKCAGKEQKKDTSTIDEEGLYQSEFGRTDQIGWRIPAVPTKENDTYWGYTSVPEEGVQWWKRLKTLPAA